MNSGVPDGFALLLPDDWVSLDLDPETTEQSVQRLVEALGHDDPAIASASDRIEQLLTALAHEAIEGEALLSAVRFDVDADGRPVQVTLSVYLRSVEGSSDPPALAAAIPATGIQNEIVELSCGQALRIVERTDDNFLVLTVLVPMPGIDGRVAAISLLSPNISHEAQLATFFDGLVDTFSFTWENGNEEVSS